MGLSRQPAGNSQTDCQNCRIPSSKGCSTKDVWLTHNRRLQRFAVPKCFSTRCQTLHPSVPDSLRELYCPCLLHISFWHGSDLVQLGAVGMPFAYRCQKEFSHGTRTRELESAPCVPGEQEGRPR